MHKFAIVVSEFNKSITDKLLAGAITQLKTQGLNENDIFIARVPGAIEIPLTALLLAKSKNYQAIICLAAVIRGETDHYDYVCQQVSQGCQRVMLDYEVPVIFGVLTTYSLEQAEERIGGHEGHKGIDAANAALDMVEVTQRIRNSR